MLTQVDGENRSAYTRSLVGDNSIEKPLFSNLNDFGRRTHEQLRNITREYGSTIHQ